MIDLKKELKKRKITLRAFEPLVGIGFRQLGTYTSGKHVPNDENEKRIKEALRIYDEAQKNSK